jgi:DNA-binding Lrp family transcriptional regulator
MGRGRKPAKELSYRDKKIVERYNSTFDTMAQLAKKYRISKQRVHEILKRAERFGFSIERPRLSPRHHRIHQCEVCTKILQLAEKDDLIPRRQLAQILSIEDEVCRWHLNQLKRASYVSKNFATIRSERLVKALQCYKNDSLSPAAISKKFGYKNFYSILSYQKKKGISVERMLKSPLVSNQKQEEEIAIFPSVSQIEI